MKYFDCMYLQSVFFAKRVILCFLLTMCNRTGVMLQLRCHVKSVGINRHSI